MPHQIVEGGNLLCSGTLSKLVGQAAYGRQMGDPSSTASEDSCFLPRSFAIRFLISSSSIFWTGNIHPTLLPILYYPQSLFEEVEVRGQREHTEEACFAPGSWRCCRKSITSRCGRKECPRNSASRSVLKIAARMRPAAYLR